MYVGRVAIDMWATSISKYMFVFLQKLQLHLKMKKGNRLIDLNPFFDMESRKMGW